VLGEEQGGDQEAGEDEEDVDPEVAAAGPGYAEVERDDGGDGRAAQTVERGEARSGRVRFSDAAC